MIKSKILIKLIISSCTIANAFLSLNAAAPLPASTANLRDTAPFNYAILPSFDIPIQRFTVIAANPNSLRSSVRTAVESLIPNIAVLPASTAIKILNTNTIRDTFIREFSKRTVMQLAAMLNPDWTTARDALLSSDSNITEPDARANFDAFQAMCAMSPTDLASAPLPPPIFVPFPTTPGLQKCNTALGGAPTQEQVIAVIRKTYYNRENLDNLTTHVNDRHIGPSAKIPDPNTSRFNAENIHSTMHYIRFVLNLILPENIDLQIIRPYPPNQANGLAPAFEDNIVYIKYLKDAVNPDKCDITIYYQFSYHIGSERANAHQQHRRLMIVLGDYTKKSKAGGLKKTNWHLKTAYSAY